MMMMLLRYNNLASSVDILIECIFDQFKLCERKKNEINFNEDCRYTNEQQQLPSELMY